MSTSRTPATAWVGPIAFAAVIISISGLFNLLTGLVAVFSDEVYVDLGATTLALDVTGWGWVHVVIGAGLLATGVALMVGRLWAQLAAVALVSVNLVTQLLLMPAYPFWSLAIMALDVVVIWALVQHGDEVPGALS